MRATGTSPQKLQNRGGVRSSQGQALYGSTLIRQSVCSFDDSAHPLTGEVLFGGKLGEIGEGRTKLRLVIGMVDQPSRMVVDIGLHVEMAVAAKVEQDCTPNALSFAAQGFVDRAADGMVGLRSWQDTLGAGELNARLEAGVLRKRAGFDEPEFLQQADERCQMPGITEIIGIFAARQARAGSWLAGDHPGLRAAAQPGADKRERNAGEIAAAARATHDNVGIITRHLELRHRLLADDGLVQ